MMLAALVISALAAMSGAQLTCRTDNFEKILPFGSDKMAERMSFPCAYYALRDQWCGNYKISMMPSNVWLKDNYRFMSMRLSVKQKDGDTWEGETTNRQIIKFMRGKGEGRVLFFTSKGDRKAFLKQDMDEDGTAFIGDKDDHFKLNLKAFHPKATGGSSFRHSGFTFTCNKNVTEFKPYPEQMCGNGSHNTVATIAEAPPYELKGSGGDVANRIVILSDVFSNTDLEQPDEKCAEAVDTFSNCGDFNRKLLVMKNCEEILAGAPHTPCVTQYSCHPMDIFNACLRWGCNGDKSFPKSLKDSPLKEDCETTGKGIDMCPVFMSVFGNLTERMRDATCYTDFLAFNEE